MSGLLASWPVRVAKALDRDENSRAIVENLDEIIRWITGRPSDSTAALDLEIEKLDIEPALARTRALAIINRMMLSRQDPWQVLGVRRGSDVDEARVRYKRLMQVFHPDRGFADSDWLSDCTARLHWAHDAIRKSPTSRSGFSAGFGKRQRRPSPPPWTKRSADPVFRDPGSGSAGSNVSEMGDVAAANFAAESANADAIQQSSAQASQATDKASGVWQFPNQGSLSSATHHQQDAEYVQQQARRTTESVAAPTASEFAKTHDVMAEDLEADLAAHDDDEPDYESVFERALNAENLAADAQQAEDEQEPEAAVDIFEQASPSSSELLKPSARMRVAKPSIAVESDAAKPDVAESDLGVQDNDQLDRMFQQRLAQNRSEQTAGDTAKISPTRTKQNEERNKQLAEQEIARLRQEAKEKSAQQRLAKKEEYRKEKEQRRLLRREQREERARAKEQLKQEKINRKHEELQAQRLEAEASEKRLKENRQRKRARAKERAEAESEKRRLKELNDLHQQEVDAISAQRAREAERRRRHLEAEGTRLSSVSERSDGGVESQTETTIPPWHEQTPEASADVAQATGKLEYAGATANLQRVSARSPSPAVDNNNVDNKVDDSAQESRSASTSNVEPIRSVSASTGEMHRESGAAKTRADAAEEAVEQTARKPRRQYRDAHIAEPQTQRAANDDTAPKTGRLGRAPRLAVVAAGVLGLVGVSVLVNKVFFGAKEAEVVEIDSAGETESMSASEVSTDTRDVADSVAEASTRSIESRGIANQQDEVAAEVAVTDTEPSANDQVNSADSSAKTTAPTPGEQRTVQSIDQPAIDRNPTTVSTKTGTDAVDRETAATSAEGSDDSVASTGEGGVNVSTEPLANVRHLAEEFSRRFVGGDADAFASLFTTEATMNEFRGAQAIRDAHADLFSSTARRHVSIKLGPIDGSGDFYNARGRLSQVLRFSDGTSKLSDSNFDLTVERTGDNYFIRTLSY